MLFNSLNNLKELDATSLLLFSRQTKIPGNEYLVAKDWLKKAYYRETGNRENSIKVILNYYMNKYTEELLNIFFLRLVVDTHWKEKGFIINNVSLFKRLNSYMKTVSDKNLVLLPNLPSVSLQELVNHIHSFLQYVDPSLSWDREFTNAVNSNRIIDKKMLSLEKKKYYDQFSNNSYTIVCKGEQTVVLDRHEDLSDIPVAIHEIIHYLASINQIRTEKLVILNEFPSCFYELVVTDYLKQIGYADRVAAAAINHRYKTHMEVSSIMDKYLTILDLIIKNGSITYKDIVKHNNETQNIITKQFSLECINTLSYDLFAYLYELPYIYGASLANMEYESLKDSPDVFRYMYGVTNDLYKLNLEDHYKDFKIKLIRKKENQ